MTGGHEATEAGPASPDKTEDLSQADSFSTVSAQAASSPSDPSPAVGLPIRALLQEPPGSRGLVAPRLLWLNLLGLLTSMAPSYLSTETQAKARLSPPQLHQCRLGPPGPNVIFRCLSGEASMHSIEGPHEQQNALTEPEPVPTGIRAKRERERKHNQTTNKQQTHQARKGSAVAMRV